MSYAEKLKKWIFTQKEGIFIGGLVGAVLATQYLYDFMHTIGIPKEPAWMAFVTSILIAMIVGSIFDAVYKPRS